MLVGSIQVLKFREVLVTIVIVIVIGKRIIREKNKETLQSRVRDRV